MTRAAIALFTTLTLAACGRADRPGDEPLDGGAYVALGLNLDQTVIADEDGDALLLLNLEATGAPPSDAAPARVALVVDTSGSMEGKKLDNAIAAAHDLVDRLRPQDELTLVAYGDSAEVLLRTRRMRRGRSAAHEAIDALTADGNTCTSCAMQAAYDALSADEGPGVHRVIILTDGHANRGVQDDDGLRAMAASAQANLGVDTTTIGLGRLHNEVALTAVAEAGAGAYYFLHNSDYLAELLDREVERLHATSVKDLTIAVRPGDGVRLTATNNVARWVGDELVFDVGPLATGEARAFVVELALPQGDLGRAAHATATFSDVAGRPYRVEGSARVERSEDLARIESSIDPHVIEQHALLMSAVTIDLAMNLVAAGDYQTARAELGANREALAAQPYSADIAAEIEQMDTMLETFAAPAAEAPAPQQAVDRGNVMLYRGQASERRRGRAPRDVYHAPEAFDMREIE